MAGVRRAFSADLAKDYLRLSKATNRESKCWGTKKAIKLTFKCKPR